MGAGRVAGPATLLRNAMRDAHTGYAHALRDPVGGVNGWLIALATLAGARAWDGIALPGNPHATAGGFMSKGKSTGAWVVTLARAGYGLALVVAPQALIKLTGDPVTGQPAGASRARPSRRACGVARVLGVRHLVQAGLTAVALRAAEPERSLPLALGAAVDVLHATTMVGLAAVDRGARRVALADTGVEVALAAAGLVTAARD
jgi:hypothetical protein